MARLLAYTAPGRGHLFPITPILDELRDRGHTIALRTLASEVPLMCTRDFDVQPVAAAIEAIEYDDWQGGNSRKALELAVRGICSRAEHDAADFQQAIQDERPDAALVDVNCWGALSAAEEWGGPWAVFCPYPLPLRSNDVPPFGPGFAPARGPLGRARDRLLRPLFFGALEKRMMPPLNGIRAGFGLGPLAGVDDFFHRAQLILYMTAEPFEYPRGDWPENVVMVGPCDWEPPIDVPSWLAEIERPIVLVTTSSEFQDDGRLVETALLALKDEPVDVVATLPAGDPTAYTIPDNAHVERFVPHGPVLDRAACAITHGGMGATQKAIARGVPVCVVPFGRDQLEVARRAEIAGAGTRLPVRRLNPRRLRAKAREAMALAAGARRVADGFAAAGGGRSGADAVEQRLLDFSTPVTMTRQR